MTNLQNKRVVITRPVEQSGDFAKELNSLGALAVFFPTIQISPLDDYSLLDSALFRMGCFDWLIFTSANAVNAFYTRLLALGISVLPAELKVASIGPRTAAGLQERGISVDFIPQKNISEEVVKGLGDVRGLWFLLPLADIAETKLEDSIRGVGGLPVVVPAYKTIPADPDADGFTALQEGVDVVTFTSGSTVRNFVSLLEANDIDPRNLPGNPIIACIGPKTAAVSTDIGLEVDLVAEEYTVNGLIDLLAAL